MKKDFFNNKLHKELSIGVVIGLVLLCLVSLLCAIMFIYIALTYAKVEPDARILLFVFAGICIVTLVAYPLLSIFAIRTYPRHKRLAHALWQPYVFVQNELSTIYDIKRSKHISAQDRDNIYNLLTNYIIHCVPSTDIQKYLYENRSSLTIMQYATLADHYCTQDMCLILKYLADFCDNDYERQLFSLAIKDYKKGKWLSERTIEFYDQNDPRKNKPSAPFAEFIYLPTLFDQFEIANFVLDGQLVVVGQVSHFSEGSADNSIYDFSDNSYMVYPLDTPLEITRENLVYIHSHAHYCELQKIPMPELTAEQKEKYQQLVQLLSEIY